ncbi:MAG: TonB-dependent receptor [Sphingobacteriales bacterium]|nr:MAG: TonB-dependent receptor [Sphingobacteriales bacterium]TAF80542.1 MAG: TonB-dependent receptor [Sphingobacteriales bacterium]
MKKYILSLALLYSIAGFSQTTFKAIVKDSETQQVLTGATAQLISSNYITSTNINGYLEINNLPLGKQKIKVSYLGYKTQTFSFILPLADTLQLSMQKNKDSELEEVIVQSTRTSRSIQNTPTRIETIEAEELDEKSNMKPANISMVLHESTGLQVQQTSATSGNASIRVQGLDGRYTQLLKDGYPNFGNFASGLSILETPPLDLKQVEIIKGPASTLFGGGAIAGAVNFISKTPKITPENNFILNQSNIGQSNLGAYSSQRKGNFAYTVLGLLNFQKLYDVDGDSFSEVPKSNNFTLNARFFYYPSTSTTLMLGNSITKGKVIGGDLKTIAGIVDANHAYFEQNKTIRNTTTLEFDKQFVNKNTFKIKQSLSFFDRTIQMPNYQFNGFNTNAFAEVSYLVKKQNHTIISGLNMMYDNFKQSTSQLNAKLFTTGLYLQHTWDIIDAIKLENGLRLDNVSYTNTIYTKNQTFILPKVSALFKINDSWNSRLGAGLGYKTPTIFTEQTETNQYQNLLPLQNVVAEKSLGATFDVSYKSLINNNLLFTINQLFFITELNKPLLLQNLGTNYFFINAHKPVVSKGLETNVKLIFKNDFKAFIGYTYTHAQATYLPNNQFLPLLPKNKLNIALVYEKERNLKLGFESYYTGRQYLYNQSQTPAFWEFGFMVEKYLYKHFSVFINFENFTNVKQSNFKRVVNPPNNKPTFDDIWTHTEGFTFNGGIKIKL